MNWIGVVEKHDEEDSNSSQCSRLSSGALRRAATEVIKGGLRGLNIDIRGHPASYVNLDPSCSSLPMPRKSTGPSE